ncbi:hypothetical protein KC363_g203 [Hortaea werneckii]|nr:hypothetical protein KC363_g203 [Hortaea werneckii]
MRAKGGYVIYRKARLESSALVATGGTSIMLQQQHQQQAVGGVWQIQVGQKDTVAAASRSLPRGGCQLGGITNTIETEKDATRIDHKTEVPIYRETRTARHLGPWHNLLEPAKGCQWPTGDDMVRWQRDRANRRWRGSKLALPAAAFRSKCRNATLGAWAMRPYYITDVALLDRIVSLSDHPSAIRCVSLGHTIRVTSRLQKISSGRSLVRSAFARSSSACGGSSHADIDVDIGRLAISDRSRFSKSATCSITSFHTSAPSSKTAFSRSMPCRCCKTASRSSVYCPRAISSRDSVWPREGLSDKNFWMSFSSKFSEVVYEASFA